MRRVLFIIIILTCLVLIGGSCNDSTTTGASKPSRLREARLYDDDYDEYNCEDFETWEEAQEAFESAGEIENDVHRLDRNGEGIACEELQ